MSNDSRTPKRHQDAARWAAHAERRKAAERKAGRTRRQNTRQAVVAAAIRSAA